MVLIIILAYIISFHLVWPGRKPLDKHVLTATGVRVKHNAWALRLGYTYYVIGGKSVFYVSYHGPSPGLFAAHPDITISYKIRLF